MSIIIITALLVLSSCMDPVASPDSMRLDFTITIVDTSIFTETLSGSTLVDSAQVFINSLSYGVSYSALTDTLGQVVFSQVLPDVYNISVTKRLRAGQVEQVVGAPTERALNGQLQNIQVSGAQYDTVIYVSPVQLGDLLISEIYYNGSPKDPIPYYFHDQFLELYNNSSDTLYLDSILVADVDYGHIEEDVIYAIHAYMFPGSGSEYPLGPGEFAVIAQDAINHTEANHSSIDLSAAHFEYFIKSPPGDVDMVNVPNMIQIHHKYGVDFLYSVFNDALVIMKVADPYALGYSEYDCLLLPKSSILDGVDYRDNLSEMDHKRLDPSIDAGLTGGFEAYRGKSVERFVDSYREGIPVLMDNNNSSIDFRVLNNPAPDSISVD